MSLSDCVIVNRCFHCQIQFSTFEAFQLHSIEQHNRIKQEPEELHDNHINSTLISRKRSKSRIKPPLVKRVKTDHAIHNNIDSNSTGRLEKQKVENKSTEVKEVACQSCLYIAKSDHLMQQHVQTQHNPQRKIYSCRVCDYSCLQERTFNLHRLKHSEQGAKFACDQCGKLFLSMGIMKRHALTHNKLKSFICDFEGCAKGFNIKSRLTDHIREVHNKPKIHGKSLNEKKLKISHKLFTKSGLSNSNASNNCGPELNSQKMMKNSHSPHQLEKRSEEQNIDDSSEISFSYLKDQHDSSSFAKDIKSETDVINVYDIILRNNDNGSDLDDTHDMSKMKHECGQSDFMASISTLIEASKFVSAEYSNLGRKNRISKFTCSWIGCGKSFRDGYNLRMHTYTHTGEMQRACILCGYTCVQKSALDKHMKAHVNEEEEEL